ncbi:MAG TPA: permease-like cell division protein FtsX [Mobilitalea sp.]|nr:permease-like cell division protein FtsX [Mobilitalea sp.]
MKTFFYNIGYFVKEVRKTIRFNPLSNLFSVLGTGLILFLLGMVFAGGAVGDQLISSLQKEAEISVYYNQDLKEDQVSKLLENIKGINGVRDASYIDKEQAESQMKETLGEEADILNLFDKNPFEAYIEVRIHLENMDSVLASIGKLNGVSYVRDNRSVLEQLQNITEGLKLLGILIILAVGITTLIIVSHMIRQGIYNNREQINTLKLLGAPGSFIGLPFVLAGLLLTLAGGVLAAVLLTVLIREGYGGLGEFLPFIPLPPKEELIQNVDLLILSISILLGLFGSLFGLISIRSSKSRG